MNVASIVFNTGIWYDWDWNSEFETLKRIKEEPIVIINDHSFVTSIILKGWSGSKILRHLNTK